MGSKNKGESGESTPVAVQPKAAAVVAEAAEGEEEESAAAAALPGAVPSIPAADAAD